MLKWSYLKLTIFTLLTFDKRLSLFKIIYLIVRSTFLDDSVAGDN